MNTRLNFLVLVIFAGLLGACASVPITGRSQINIVSDSVLQNAANANFAKLITSASSKNAVLLSSESPAAANTVANVNRVSNRIIDAAGLRGAYNWQVAVLKSNTPNAFVMPNGKIVVYTGILPIAKNDAGLAAILGHEVAHVVAKHSAERMSQTLLVQTALSTADAAMAAKNQSNQPLVAAALGLGAQYGILLPFSREHELEADRIGQIYMAKAGYDPSEAIAVWERMAANSGKSNLEFASTHPANQTRRQMLTKWLPEANMFYADRNRPLPSSLAEMQSARLASAAKSAISPLGLMPEVKEGYWYKGKSSASASEVTYRYEKIEPCDVGRCISISSSSNTRRTITTDYRIVKVDNSNGTWSRFSPPIQQIRFPARVDDSWESPSDVQTSDGKTRKVLFKSQIVAYESVVVPAGTFMAYKTVTSAAGAKFFEGWYVPEVRTFVKSTNFNSNGQETTTVLTDYQKETDLAEDFVNTTKPSVP
jgi:Zn-dependent protease with chaperone function